MADLAPRFWPYAFHHFICLYNVTPHGNQSTSPYKIETGEKPDLCHLRIFGCCVYALPSHANHPNCFSNGHVGIFLGFSKSMKNVLYYDVETKTVKTAQHVAFDESMSDLGIKPPNMHLLDALCKGTSPDILDFDLPLPDLNVSPCPFQDVSTFSYSSS